MAPRTSIPSIIRRQQCLGIPIFDTDSRVIDPSHAAELPPGEVGEIIMHGPQVMLGYWNKPEETAQGVHRTRRQAILSHRRSGQNRRGRLFLHRRSLEAHDQRVGLQGVAGRSRVAHVPASGDAGGLRHRRQDAHRGETVKAVIVLRPSGAASVEAQDHQRLVPRADGGLQGAAPDRVRRCAAEVGFRQDHVARTAGTRKRSAHRPSNQQTARQHKS
jgi:fatty-acyl-CoA synthase